MKRDRESGFSLVELMVVIVLIGLLAGVVTTQVWPILFGSKKKIALTQIKEIEKSIELFRLDKSRLPETLDELTEATDDRPTGYLKELPRDPWDQDYIYDPGGGGRSEFLILSPGPDMTEGTEDDITNEATDERN